MYHQDNSPSIRLHLHMSFEFQSLHFLIDLLPDLLLLQLSELRLPRGVRSETRTGKTGRVQVSEPLVLIDLILQTPLYKPLDILSCLLLQFLLLLHLPLLLPLLLLHLPLFSHLIHHPLHCQGLLNSWFQLFLRLKFNVLFDKVEVFHFPQPRILGVLDDDDVSDCEWLVVYEIEVELGLLVELLDGVEGVDVARGSDADYFGVLGEYFVTDRVLVLPLLVLGPVHRDEISNLHSLSCHRVLGVLLEERNYVQHLEDMSLEGAHGVLEGGQ